MTDLLVQRQVATPAQASIPPASARGGTTFSYQLKTWAPLCRDYRSCSQAVAATAPPGAIAHANLQVECTGWSQDSSGQWILGVRLFAEPYLPTAYDRFLRDRPLIWRYFETVARHEVEHVNIFYRLLYRQFSGRTKAQAQSRFDAALAAQCAAQEQFDQAEGTITMAQRPENGELRWRIVQSGASAAYCPLVVPCPP